MDDFVLAFFLNFYVKNNLINNNLYWIFVDFILGQLQGKAVFALVSLDEGLLHSKIANAIVIGQGPAVLF